jgi:hypothetical protein
VCAGVEGIYRQKVRGHLLLLLLWGGCEDWSLSGVS